MSWLGVLTHKFDDIGVFTYWLQNDSDSVSPSNYCSIMVQRNVKVCICFCIKLKIGFPEIANDVQ